ncbi:hypothetical protein ACFWDI_08980 [Streptomyces sp. NPDC060064]|uniref:hypothetical protein n=1 Tax=Streptomyces sp. NPDC060064 TaxID=3347049 RepID=UPI00368BC978
MFFNWRARWQVLEEAQYRLIKQGDELDFLLARTAVTELSHAALNPLFTRWQFVWTDINRRRMELRPGDALVGPSVAPRRRSARAVRARDAAQCGRQQ